MWESKLMKSKDSGRKWMWWFLAVVAALQLYFVRELLAAFALFAIGFAALAVVVSSVYLLQKSWESGVVRLQHFYWNTLSMARHRFSFAEELAEQPFHRPDSEPVQ
jgi:hypothetical protein